MGISEDLDLDVFFGLTNDLLSARYALDRGVVQALD